MVSGIDLFKEKFKDYANCYTVIGGVACDILMMEARLNFRETRDIDMILVMEDNFSGFTKLFWEYVKDGGYKYGWKGSGKMNFYRFTEPKVGYPAQIELFSRNPEHFFDIESGIIPVHIDDDVSSLSAILLNDDYYNLMIKGRRVVNGLTVLDSEYLILFKMYAFVNCNEDKKNGKFVKERDWKKHKYDVFRLLQIADREKHIEVPDSVKHTVEMFIELMDLEDIPYHSLDIRGNKNDDLNSLKKMYL